MQEGSPSDPAPVSAEPEVTTPVEPTEAELDEVTSTERTPDEVEAIWKNRVAGKDRAHAAETATLRNQIEEMNRRLDVKEQQDMTNLSEAEQWKVKAETAVRERDEERQNRILDVRSTKYAAAAEHLDEATLVSMDEAKLAALNSRLSDDEGTPPPPIDPSLAPKRSSASPAAPREKSVEELESDLKRNEPEFVASLQQ